MNTPMRGTFPRLIRSAMRRLRRWLLPDGTSGQARYHQLRVRLDRWFQGPPEARLGSPAVATLADQRLLSIVVMAVDADPRLVDAARSIATQSPASELIVINSGRPGASRLIRAAGIHALVIECSRRLMPGATRNVGIAASHGKFIAFLAADCRARAGWVANRIRAHQAGRAIVSSPVVNDRTGNPFSTAAHLLLFSTRLPGTPPSRRLHYGASYDRALFEQHGVFNPDLRTGEDSEFHARLGKAFRPHFHPLVQTEHANPRTPSALMLDQYRRGQLAAGAYMNLGGAVTPGQVARNSVQRLARMVRTAFAATPGRDWPRLLWALPWTVPGAFAYALGAIYFRHAPPGTFSVASPPKRELVCLLQLRNDRRFLHAYLENVAPHVDGILALDDGSSDGGAEILNSHPAVVELLRVDAPHPYHWNELRNRQLLIDAAGRHGGRWVVAVDADERLERHFRQRANQVIAHADRHGHLAYNLTLRELWDSPAHYRADGIWGGKAVARLFKYRSDHDFGRMELHGTWAPLNSRPEGRGFPTADLIIYHQRMIHPLDRQQRRDRYKRLDPERKWQRIGYDYLTELEGLHLERLPEGRDYLPLRPPEPPDKPSKEGEHSERLDGEPLESAARMPNVLP